MFHKEKKSYIWQQYPTDILILEYLCQQIDMSVRVEFLGSYNLSFSSQKIFSIQSILDKDFNLEKHEFFRVQLTVRNAFLITVFVRSSVCLPKLQPNYRGRLLAVLRRRPRTIFLVEIRQKLTRHTSPIRGVTEEFAKREANVEIIAHVCRWYAAI